MCGGGRDGAYPPLVEKKFFRKKFSENGKNGKFVCLSLYCLLFLLIKLRIVLDLVSAARCIAFYLFR